MVNTTILSLLSSLEPLKIEIPYHMDPRESADDILIAFTTSQQQILLILEIYMNDHIRIEQQQSPNIRQHIRQLPYFRLVHESDICCLESTRMDRRCFAILCELLKTKGGLVASGVVDVEEMVAMFLHILAHDVNNLVVLQRQFAKHGETLFKHFNSVLTSVLKLQKILLKKPKAITSTCTDDTWNFFENCLGALDGTYFKVSVSVADRSRYITKRCETATNVLVVCNPKGEFIYVLVGWEGSADDSRILRDSIFQHGFKVPKGYYYLCDKGYINAKGFLAPYRGVRYHPSEWRKGGNVPTTAKEYFNMKHAAARNVIEVTVEALKDRWTILRGKSYYPVDIKCRIIIACCMVNNLISREMSNTTLLNEDSFSGSITGESIKYVESCNEWNRWRDDLAERKFSWWQQQNRSYN